MYIHNREPDFTAQLSYYYYLYSILCKTEPIKYYQSDGGT